MLDQDAKPWQSEDVKLVQSDLFVYELNSFQNRLPTCIPNYHSLTLTIARCQACSVWPFCVWSK